MRTPNRLLALVAAFFFLGTPLALGLTGCESLGLTKPQSVEQRLVYAYSTHTAILEATANGVAAGTLTPEDGERVLKLSDESRLLLDAGRAALSVGDTSTAEGRLVLALGILTQLQTYLNARGVK